MKMKEASAVIRRISRIWRRVSTERRGYNFGARLPRSAVRPDVSKGQGQLEQFFDANRSGPGIWKWRHYFDIYERHLAKFRGREVHIVEIGVYSGGSLRMWHDYFGPDCRVYGVDIEPGCKAYETDRTSIFIGDQANPHFWADLLQRVPRIDVVIDDGGHEARQQIATLEAVLPHIAPGGVYWCEDIVGTDNPFYDYIAGLARNLHRKEDIASPSWSLPEVVPARSFQRHVQSVHTYPFVAVLEVRSGPIDSFSSERRGTHWQPFYEGTEPEERGESS